MMNSKVTLEKSDIKRACRRHVWGSGLCPGYELMAAPSMYYSLGPSLEKMYPSDEEFKKVTDSLFTYYNTNPYAGGLIVGSCLAIYEKSDTDLDTTIETVASVKTGLMGPMAGIGDAILSSLPMTIFGALCSYMALEGNAVGMLIGIAFSAIMTFFIKPSIFNIGYQQGSKFITSFSSQIKAVTKAANILGLTVVGALLSSVVKLKTGLMFSQGEMVVSLQDTLNTVSANLLPALLVIFVYWLLGKEKMTSSKVILVLIAMGFVGYFLNIFV